MYYFKNTLSHLWNLIMCMIISIAVYVYNLLISKSRHGRAHAHTFFFIVKGSRSQKFEDHGARGFQERVVRPLVGHAFNPRNHHIWPWSKPGKLVPQPSSGPHPLELLPPAPTLGSWSSDWWTFTMSGSYPESSPTPASAPWTSSSCASSWIAFSCFLSVDSKQWWNQH